jgi:hypothetical protein
MAEEQHLFQHGWTEMDVDTADNVGHVFLSLNICRCDHHFHNRWWDVRDEWLGQEGWKLPVFGQCKCPDVN